MRQHQQVQVSSTESSCGIALCKALNLFFKELDTHDPGLGLRPADTFCVQGKQRMATSVAEGWWLAVELVAASSEQTVGFAVLSACAIWMEALFHPGYVPHYYQIHALCAQTYHSRL